MWPRSFLAVFFGRRPFSLMISNELDKDEVEGDSGFNPAGI